MRKRFRPTADATHPTIPTDRRAGLSFYELVPQLHVSYPQSSCKTCMGLCTKAIRLPWRRRATTARMCASRHGGGPESGEPTACGKCPPVGYRIQRRALRRPLCHRYRNKGQQENQNPADDGQDKGNQRNNRFHSIDFVGWSGGGRSGHGDSFNA